MALGEFLGVGPATVRAFGLAGLLHDLGKVRIPREILNKPGKLTPEERAVVEAHPAEGARMILEGSEPLDLAAVVAYEHHLYLDGGGYPPSTIPGLPTTPAGWCTCATSTMRCAPASLSRRMGIDARRSTTSRSAPGPSSTRRWLRRSWR